MLSLRHRTSGMAESIKHRGNYGRCYVVQTFPWDINVFAVSCVEIMPHDPTACYCCSPVQHSFPRMLHKRSRWRVPCIITLIARAWGVTISRNPSAMLVSNRCIILTLSTLRPSQIGSNQFIHNQLAVPIEIDRLSGKHSIKACDSLFEVDLFQYHC